MIDQFDDADAQLLLGALARPIATRLPLAERDRLIADNVIIAGMP
jgi:hypothetical protein